MDEIIEQFMSTYKCTLNYNTIEFGLGKVHAFFIQTDELSELWKEMRNFIAIKFQNKLTIEFERWNVYVFYMVESPIDNELKYQIENDTFSSRKIVIEGNYNIDKIIDEHIRNSDINIESNTSSESNFTPNPLICNQIKDIEAKGKLTQKIKDAHEEIVKIIKGESREI